MIHELKCINPYFTDVWNDNKTFELRLNDRDYKIGDELWLAETLPGIGKVEDQFLNRCIKVTITHMIHHCQFPEILAPNYVIMSILIITKLTLTSQS